MNFINSFWNKQLGDNTVNTYLRQKISIHYWLSIFRFFVLLFLSRFFITFCATRSNGADNTDEDGKRTRNGEISLKTTLEHGTFLLKWLWSATSINRAHNNLMVQ